MLLGIGLPVVLVPLVTIGLYMPIFMLADTVGG